MGLKSPFLLGIRGHSPHFGDQTRLYSQSQSERCGKVLYFQREFLVRYGFSGMTGRVFLELREIGLGRSCKGCRKKLRAGETFDRGWALCCRTKINRRSVSTVQ